MFGKSFGKPSRTLQLPARPSLKDVQKLLADSRQKKGERFSAAWASTDSMGPLVLSVVFAQGVDEPEWKLVSGSGSSSETLWVYPTLDANLVLEMLSYSTGPQAASREEAARETDRLADEKSDQRITRSMLRSELSLDLRLRAQEGLKGDVSQIHLVELLRSIVFAEMNGTLYVTDDYSKGASALSRGSKGQIEFSDGRPVSASIDGEKGIEAFLTIAGSTQGEYNFAVSNQPPNARSQTSPTDNLLWSANIETLLSQASQLAEEEKYIRTLLADDSTVEHKQSNFSEKQLVDGLEKFDIAQLEAARNIYRAFAGSGSTLDAAIGNLSIARSVWLPAVAAMFRAGIISVKDETAISHKALQPKPLDEGLIQQCLNTLKSPVTGIFTYSSFLFLLEREFLLMQRRNLKMSLILLDCKLRGDKGAITPLSQEGVWGLRERIEQIVRPADVLGHYGAHYLAILLPDTELNGASSAATRLVKAIQKSPLADGITDDNLMLFMGIASIPQDFLDIPWLLAGTEAALEHAQRSNSKVFLYKNLREQQNSGV